MQLNNVSESNFEQCLKCSICTAYCPVSGVNPLYPGPKQSGPDGERYRLKDPNFYNEALKMCLNCKRCEVACPHGVNVGDIILKARMLHAPHKPSLRDMMLASTDLMGTMATLAAPVTNYTLSQRASKATLHSLLGIDKRRTFPTYASQRFETWFKKHAAPHQGKYSKHVSYFHGCYVNYNNPQLGKDLVKILNACGYGVHLLKGEKCCGTPLIANGLFNQARKQGKKNTATMRQAIDKGHTVVTTGLTCTFTMRDEYSHVLDIDNHDVREHIELATKFLFRLVDEESVKLAFNADYHKRVAYHTACHMERMGWSIYSTMLLKMIPGLELLMLESQCCGIAGTYGFKRENYKTSQLIGEPLFEAITNAQVDAVATECETCKWQIEMSTGVPVLNPITIIADAIDEEKTIEINKIR